MTTYRLSNGQRLSKKRIDQLIRKAKAEKLANQLEAIGYNVCEDCYKNDCVPIDCSHNISVDQCQKDPETPLELAWDLDNITIRGRRCHKIWDKTT
jgi:hypothetical protein